MNHSNNGWPAKSRVEDYEHLSARLQALHLSSSTTEDGSIISGPSSFAEPDHEPPCSVHFGRPVMRHDFGHEQHTGFAHFTPFGSGESECHHGNGAFDGGSRDGDVSQMRSTFRQQNGDNMALNHHSGRGFGRAEQNGWVEIANSNVTNLCGGFDWGFHDDEHEPVDFKEATEESDAEEEADAEEQDEDRESGDNDKVEDHAQGQVKPKVRTYVEANWDGEAWARLERWEETKRQMRRRSRSRRRKSADTSINWLDQEFDDEETDEEEDEEDNRRLHEYSFPKEYEFLTKVDKVDDRVVLSNRKLLERVMNDQPATIQDLVDKQVALVCLYWAQSLIESREPIFKDALLTCTRHYITKVNEEVDEDVEESKGKQKKKGKKKKKKKAVSKVVMFFSLQVILVKSPADRDDRDDFLRQVRLVGKDDVSLLTAFVTRRTPRSLHLKLSMVKDEAAMKLVKCKGVLVDVYALPDEFVPKSMARAVDGVLSGELDALLMPEPQLPAYDEDLYFGARALALFQGVPEVASLNFEQQCVALAFVKGYHKPYPFILYGPPGTGKTESVAGVCKYLIRSDPKARILICTPSNRAADRVAEKLLEYVDEENLKLEHILRLVTASNDYDKRNTNLDKIIRFDSTINRYVIPGKKELQNYRIIVCTLACSSHIISARIPRGHFSHIILDEAGQASEPELWIPVGGLASADTSVMLCGDPKQLGPVIALDLTPLFTDRFVSPLCRFVQNEHYQSDYRLCIQLRECYRCHPAIVEIASLLFYGNNLVPAANCESKDQLRHWSFLPTPGFPVMFLDVAQGEETREPNGMSYANEHELAYVLEGVQDVLQSLGLSARDVGVISPYRYQSRLLNARLRAHAPLARHADDLTVDSVERFQGSERRVIFMTCTRTQGLGFVGCPLRLNTSITRAQQLLVVIGNGYALGKHRDWKTFIEYCHYYGSYQLV